MQKKTIQRLAAAGVLSVAVAATLLYAGTRDSGESLTYNELLALAGDEEAAASVEAELEATSNLEENSALSRLLEEIEAEDASADSEEADSAASEENTAAEAGSEASTSSETAASSKSEAAASSASSKTASSAVSGASHSTAAPDRDYASSGSAHQRGAFDGGKRVAFRGRCTARHGFQQGRSDLRRAAGRVHPEDRSPPDPQ